MNIALRQPMTMAEFLDWEERQELRYEFDGFRPVAMTGGSRAHDAVQVNVVIALGIRLRGKACRINGSNLKIEVMGNVRYPDAYVTCGPIHLAGTVASNPVVIFEVLSKGTARTDRIVKNHEYASTLSIQRYVMLEQTQIAGMMFERVGDDWVGHLLGPDSILVMPEIGIEVPIAEFYDGLDLATLQGDETD